MRQLIASIQRYVDEYNLHKRPFMWTATADSIIEKWGVYANLLLGQNTRMDPFSVDSLLKCSNEATKDRHSDQKIEPIQQCQEVGLLQHHPVE